MIAPGQQYGKLIVLYPENMDETSTPSRMWTCKCACGNIVLLSEIEILNEHCQRACLDTRGELCAADLFEELDLEYQAMKKFDDFKYTFDFYLPYHDIVIECDGAQHFRAKNNDWDSDFKLQEMRERDEAKTKYCREHDIMLYRICFWDHEKINQLKERLIWKS